MTYLTAIFLAAALLVGIWDLRAPPSRLRGWLIVAATVVVFGLLYLLIGFPRPGAASFGASPLLVCGLMFIAVILGVVASYVYELKTTFSWPELLRPVVTAPIILLPLLGSINSTSDVSTMQVVFLCLVSFQNGFFWKIVLQKSATAMAEPKRKAGTARP